MCIDDVKQSFVFLKAFSEAGGSFPPDSAEKIVTSMKDISRREFGAETYATKPHHLSTLSRHELQAGNIVRNVDRSISITDEGRSIEEVLYHNFIHRM